MAWHGRIRLTETGVGTGGGLAERDRETGAHQQAEEWNEQATSHES